MKLKPSSLRVLCFCTSAYKVGNLSCCSLTLLSALSTRGISAKYGCSPDVISMFYVLAAALMASDPPACSAHMVITQPHGREGQRRHFNQRANENIWSWKIKTRNYSGGFIARSLGGPARFNLLYLKIVHAGEGGGRGGGRGLLRRL